MAAKSLMIAFENPEGRVKAARLFVRKNVDQPKTYFLDILFDLNQALQANKSSTKFDQLHCETMTIDDSKQTQPALRGSTGLLDSKKIG